MFGERAPRCHAAQLVEFTQRLAQILEFRAEVFAEWAGGAHDVVAGLAQRARRPADGAGQALGSQDHQNGDHKEQHPAPAPVGDDLDALLSASGAVRFPTFTTTSFSRIPPFSAGPPAFTLAICAPEAMSLLTERAVRPSVGWAILPSLISASTVCLTSLTGIAKPRPLALSDSDLPAVLMPITSEFMLISGPPELPWLIDASVCTPSITVSVSEPSPESGTGRCSALMMPCVTVLRRPSGAPAAITSSPTLSFSESPTTATTESATVAT